MMATESTTLESVPTLTCVICDSDTPAESLYCSHCHAPLDISHAVEDRGTPARFISILGPSNAGKTVYLGLMLDMLTKGCGSLRGVPNGPFSIAVQQETIRALENRRFPAKTMSEADDWRWVHCEVTPKTAPKRITDIITPDMAGEAIALEVERAGSYPIIRSVVSKSQGLILLFDSQRARDKGREEDLFAMKLMSYLVGVFRRGGGRKWRKIGVPISIVLTKADRCPDAMAAPEAFATSTMPGLVQACGRDFSKCRFFAAGTIGSYAMATDSYGRRSQVPLHVEPHGILEPLEWVIGR